MQEKTVICQASGCPGAYVTRNPIVSTASGYRAKGNVNIGGFCWEDNEGYVSSSGSGKPLGFVVFDHVYDISDCCCEDQDYVPAGENVCVAAKGDFFAIAPFGATLGQKVFACLLDGSLGAGGAGEEIEGYVETDYVYERSCAPRETTVISNWNTLHGNRT